MGMLRPENSYQVQIEDDKKEKSCIIILKNKKQVILSQSEWETAVIKELEKRGYSNEEIEEVII